MKTITINIAKQTVTVNGETCNFYEAGLINSDGIMLEVADLEDHFEQREGEEVEIEFEQGSELAESLIRELADAKVSPDVKMFVDESAIFWVTKSGHFIWMQDHKGLKGDRFKEIDDPTVDWNPDWVDENHKVVEEKTPEGVGNYGVYWMNGDFDSPFHITDFLERIETINIVA